MNAFPISPFVKQGLLTPIGTRLYAEAIRLNKVDNLPKDILEVLDVSEQPDNETQIDEAIELAFLLKNKDFNTLEISPYFLNQFLNSIVCQAIQEYDSMSMSFRSSGAGFALVAPVQTQHIYVQKNLDFEWESDVFEEVSLTIKDNQRKTKFEGDIPPEFSLNTTSPQFEKGLYYYFLHDDEGELLDIGKFYVYR